MRLRLLFEGGEHSCPIRYRKPGDDRWAGRNRRSCSACDAEFEAELDRGFEDLGGSGGEGGSGGDDDLRDPPPSFGELKDIVGRFKAPWELYNEVGLKHGDSCPECGSVLRNKHVGMGAPKFLGCSNLHAFPLGVRDVKARKGRELHQDKPAPAVELDPDQPKAIQVLDILRSMGGERWSRRGEERFGRRIRSKGVCEFGGCGERVSQEHGRPKRFCADHVMENPYAREVRGGAEERGVVPRGEGSYEFGGEEDKRLLALGNLEQKKAKEAWDKARGELGEPGDPKGQLGSAEEWKAYQARKRKRKLKKS